MEPGSSMESGSSMEPGSSIDRGSSKHGPRLDEEMQHEVRPVIQSGVDSRAEEWRDPEPPGEDQPNPSWAPTGYERAGAPPGMTPAEVEQRSRLGRYIPLRALPGTRDRLLVAAGEMHAPDDILAELARLPEGESYRTVYEIWVALGHHTEPRRT
jgi:hypothetical protein